MFKLTSDNCTVKYGVPQGSLLGPLMYLCYCNDMAISVESRLILYADDSIIITSHANIDVIKHKLGSELSLCNRWLVENKLSLHMGKCECILYGSKRKIKNVSNFSVPVDGHSISAKPNIKYLGTILEHDLSGKAMVLNIISKANSRLKFLYRNSKYLATSTRKSLCLALIQNNMDYACMAWYFGLSKCLKNKLQIIQNKMVRFIMGQGPRFHVGHNELRNLSMLSVDNRVCQLSLNIVHKLFYGNGPSYLEPNFTKISRNVNTRSNNRNFNIPQVNNVTSCTFYYNAIKHWNSIPSAIKDVADKRRFKILLKSHLLDAQTAKGINVYAY